MTSTRSHVTDDPVHSDFHYLGEGVMVVTQLRVLTPGRTQSPRLSRLRCPHPQSGRPRVFLSEVDPHGTDVKWVPDEVRRESKVVDV